MSSLRSVVDELRAETLAELPDALVEEDFAELQRACEQLEVERLRRLAELDRRRLFERDGYLSAASWLVSTCRLGWGAAREQVRLARALEQMPKTREALVRGGVSLAGVRVLASARDVDPEAFASVEDSLVEAARITRSRTWVVSPRTGGRPSRPEMREREHCAGGAGSMRRSRSRAWCGSTATSIPRPGRPC